MIWAAISRTFLSSSSRHSAMRCSALGQCWRAAILRSQITTVLGFCGSCRVLGQIPYLYTRHLRQRRKSQSRSFLQSGRPGPRAPRPPGARQRTGARRPWPSLGPPFAGRRRGGWSDAPAIPSNYSHFTVAHFTLTSRRTALRFRAFTGGQGDARTCPTFRHEQAEDVTMLQNFLNQFRERKSATSDEQRDDLERAIIRLRETLGIDWPREMT